MRKMNLSLLLVALVGIGAAYANRPLEASPKQLHRYSYWFKSGDGSRMYYQFDITAEGWTQGLDYTCNATTATCTFLADPTRAHMDISGSYFFVWDVPGAGIQNTGAFEFMF
jgi:hypothetical protein